LSWQDGYDHDEYASGCEYYYAEMADNGENGPVFCACELQNDPTLLRSDEDKRQLTRSMILSRCNGLTRWRAPNDAKVGTGFCDVHGLNSHVYWSVSWWSDGFRGGLAAFGKWPAKVTIGQKYKGMSEEAAIRKALDDCERHIMQHDLVSDSGHVIPIYVGEDSGAGNHKPIVFEHCKACQSRNWVPTKGEGTGGREWHTLHKAASVRGDHWVVSPQESKTLKMRVYSYDVDYWKCHIANRLMVPTGDRTSYTLFGNTPSEFAELSHHATAEKSERLEIKDTGHEFTRWTNPRRAANHWWDTMVGSAMLASVHGVSLPHQTTRRRRKRRKAKVTLQAI
jgi:hypothetical protein